MAADNEEGLIITPVPALVAVLLNLESKKGSPLTEEEVLKARDNASCVAMPKEVHESIVESRGYSDIDPERAWEEWLEIRPSPGSGVRV